MTGHGGKWRVAFVNSHPIQYFAPLYAHINRSPDIEAVPIYLSDVSLRGGYDKGFGRAVKWDLDLLEGTDPIFVKNAGSHHFDQGLKLIAPDIWSIVRSGRFDSLVVHGYAFGANHVAIAAAKSAGIPIMVRGESHLGLKGRGWKSKIRAAIIPHFYHRFDAFLAIGTANRNYYRSLGIPESRIFHFPYSVDNMRLLADSEMSPAQRSDYRSRLGLNGDNPAVLFASKFEKRKHADDLIRACGMLRREGLALQLVMAGTGEMDAELRSLSEAEPDLHVIFPGFVNQSELPKLFGACEIFVLPSEEEPWGLIINEAMCAGLPVVASREIGAVTDLVYDGYNGQVFDAKDVRGLANALRPIVADPALRACMGSRSRAIIAAWSYVEAEQGLRAALSFVAPTKRTTAT
ncbi:MAG: glycosyltransferase family 4 protein [Sphingosinicella sp.]|uniref:glycosyltransferase family 4 protein n=1 Tax=Sphingosinicella sp. TaxID=1917971 RepID=UPI004037D64B